MGIVRNSSSRSRRRCYRCCGSIYFCTCPSRFHLLAIGEEGTFKSAKFNISPFKFAIPQRLHHRIERPLQMFIAWNPSSRLSAHLIPLITLLTASVSFNLMTTYNTCPVPLDGHAKCITVQDPSYSLSTHQTRVPAWKQVVKFFSPYERQIQF